MTAGAEPRAGGIRAVEHIGITVPNIEEASRFFFEALGAEVLYDTKPSQDSRAAGALAGEEARLGTRPGARWRRSRLLHLGAGPSIELFEYDDDERRSPPTPGDLGIQHFAVYVDDMEAAIARIVAAGGRALEGPFPLPGPESGEGNSWIYTLAPWGGIVELVSYPSPQPYEETTHLRRWRPPPRSGDQSTTPERKETR